ncbi:MAG: 3-ketoacyl-ACP reductase [Alphaproteobacteria bacterium]
MTADPIRPVALVTGAQRGLGRACAAALAARGFDLVLHALDPDEDLAACAADVAAAGGRWARVAGDIAEIGTHGALVDAAAGAFGRLDCLVNNAGVSVLARGDLLEVSPESYDRCQAVNARGTFFLTQAFARHLLAAPQPAAGHRSIVVISSVNAEAVALNRGEYCVSKAGAAMVARLFAVRLAEAGIGVYDIRPGIIRTEMTAPSTARYDAFFAAGGAPMPRWGEPGDVGRAVAAAAAGDLGYTVGQVLYIDGGLTVARF